MTESKGWKNWTTLSSEKKTNWSNVINSAQKLVEVYKKLALKHIKLYQKFLKEVTKFSNQKLSK